MEQFFGNAIPFNPEDGTTQGFTFEFDSRGSMPDFPLESSEQTEIEKIELDDRLIVIVSGLSDIAPPKVKLVGETLVIVDPLGVNDEILTLPFPINAFESHASVRNGIIDITLYRANDVETSSEIGEHVLRII